MITESKSSVNSPDPASETAPVAVVTGDEACALSVDEVVKDTVTFFRSGQAAARKSWKDIMSGALRLIWLQSQHSSQGSRNDLVPNGKKSGFNRVLEELGVPTSNAYRWMGHARGFLTEIGISDGSMPPPGTDEWERMQRFVLGKVDLLSFLKLPIRTDALPSDDEVLTRLRSAAEVGDQEASDLLDNLIAGGISLDEATRKYCRVGEPPNRPEPAMLKLDPKTLEPKGRMLKALDTLESAFSEWETFDPQARIQAKQRIRAVFSKIPPECDFREF